jgi:hypothetical protein
VAIAGFDSLLGLSGFPGSQATVTNRFNTDRFEGGSVVMPGLDELTPDGEDSSSGGKTTHVKYLNPRNASDDIAEGTEHRHKQKYYDAAQELRHMFGQNINTVVGEFMVAAADAEKREDYSTMAKLAYTTTGIPFDDFLEAYQDAINEGSTDKLEELFEKIANASGEGSSGAEVEGNSQEEEDPEVDEEADSLVSSLQ